MELSQLLFGQVLLFSSLLSTIALAESNRSAASLKYICNMPFIKVKGEKGSILFLFAVSSIVVFILELFDTQAKIGGLKTFSKRAKKAKHQQLKGVIMLFISFICAYIFQSLTYRVNNLFGIGLVAINLHSFFALLGLHIIKIWFDVVIITCNVLIFSFTFIKNADIAYSIIVSFLRRWI